MADIIRKAVIELELKQKKSRLEAPAVDGFKAEAAAASKAEAATSKAEQTTKRLGETSKITAYQMTTSFRESGEGALRLARGLAFLSASGNDDMKKLAQAVITAQAAFDIAAGSLKVIVNLGRIIGGPGAAAVLTLGTAAGFAAKEFFKIKAAVEESEKAITRGMERGRREVQKFYNEIQRLDSLRASRSERLIGTQLTDRNRHARLREALGQEQAGVAGAQREIANINAEFGPAGVDIENARPGVLSRLRAATQRQADGQDRVVDLLRQIHQDFTKPAFEIQQGAVGSTALFAGAGGSLGGFAPLGAAGVAGGVSALSRLTNQAETEIANLQRIMDGFTKSTTILLQKVQQIDNQLQSVNPR